MKTRRRSDRPPPPPPKDSPLRVTTTRLKSPMLTGEMADQAERAGADLNPDQVDRAREIVIRLLIERGWTGKEGDRSGAYALLQRESAGNLKQQTMSALVNNRQCGFQVARMLDQFVGGNTMDYIVHGTTGTKPAGKYSGQKMKYKGKGPVLDQLVGLLPDDFLDFTAERAPESGAERWSGLDWFAHINRELELWKYMKAQKK